MAMKIDRARLFDKRVVQRNIRAGRVTKDEYQAWLADQSDVGDKIMAREEGGDDDGYEVPVKSATLSIAPSPFSVPASLLASSSSLDDDDDDDDDEDEDDEDDEDDDEEVAEPPTSDQAG